MKLLAYQIGSEVSLNELSLTLGVNKKTVERYIDLLVKSFIIYPLGSFSRNLRSEVNKKKKYYFIDIGIRNAIIDNFNPPSEIGNIGGLWENFLIMERLKLHLYQQKDIKVYFWRTWKKQEIDLIESTGDKINGFEFKYNPKAAEKVRLPQTFLKAYPEARFSVIHRLNFLNFVLG